MNARWGWIAGILVAVSSCTPSEPSGTTAGPSAAPTATVVPIATASIAVPAGVRTPLPPVITNVPTLAPSPVSTSTYNALFTPGKAWLFRQSITADGSLTESQVRVVVVEVAGDDATIAVQEAPFPSPGPGEIPGRRTRFALDAENPFEKWGTAGGETPRTTSVISEAVSVPAGAFQATKYTYESVALGYETHRELWVATGSGLVKLVSTLRPVSSKGPPTSTTQWDLSRRP